MSSKKLLNRTCFVPGCTTGYSSARKRQKEMNENSASLFKAPEDVVRLKEWERAIPRKDKALSSNNVVCSLHFREDDILYFYETKLPDGTINKIKRGRPKLKHGAIPTIFPSLPSYLTKKSTKRKPPRERNAVFPSIKRLKLEEEAARSSITFENKDTGEDSNTSKQNREKIDDQGHGDEVNRTQYPSFFEDLKNSLSILDTPNKQWSGTFISGTNEILLCEWDDSYLPKRRILIRKDMSFQILLGRGCGISGGPEMISSLGELENVMKTVANMRLCTD